jgi:hypothetical protein
MLVEWTNPTTSGYTPQEEWINRDASDDLSRRNLTTVPWLLPPPPPRQTRRPASTKARLLPSPSTAPPLAAFANIPDLGASLRSLLGSRAILNLSIRDFCEHVNLDRDAKSGSINQLYRGRESGMVHHEFLAFSVIVSRSSSLWGRLDRRPVAKDSFLLSSPTAASDMVRHDISSLSAESHLASSDRIFYFTAYPFTPRNEDRRNFLI